MDTQQTRQYRAMAGLLCLALAACSSTDSSMNGSTPATNGSMNSGMNGSMSGAAPSAASAPAMPAADTAGGASQSTQVAYGTVQAIDPMTRQDVGVGMAGAAAVGGSVGSPGDKVYRITVRLDDGTSQMVVQDAMPGYQVGDRIRYSNGMVQRY